MPAARSARRVAAHWHWVVDALAGDEASTSPSSAALVGASPEPLGSRSYACRRSPPSPARARSRRGRTILRVDATRSCEELLLELLGQVGSSGSLEKAMFPPFIKDIQKFIHTKSPALLETSFELLKEVNPELTRMAPPSPMEQGWQEQWQ
ncbi:hypothetical protein D1007_34925 [Hordeum vulgare]|nr:hypothetical protein D1007_34925 [Hordeum vulgare]